jgi:CBS domain-containing protein
MSIGEYCNREVVITERGTEIREAAKLMRQHHVGDLVVVERRGDEAIPVGVVTDRDLVIEVLAQELDMEAVTVGDVMSMEIVTARESEELWDTLNRMRSQGIRRMPVVNERGGLEGIITADDIVEVIAEGVMDLAKLIRREIEREARQRR